MPEVSDVNWSDGNYEKAKQMIDFGISLASSRKRHIESFIENYNAYHGNYTAEEVKKITDINGLTSRTEFRGMRFAKVKLDRLIGEAIELNFQAEVTTINRDAILRKSKEIAKAKGRSLMKPFVEDLKQQGHDIYSGVNIPDYGDSEAWDPKNFRTNNEKIMQILLRKKLSDDEISYIYPMLFTSAIFTSEIHSLIVDRGANNYFIQPIPSEQMIFMETGLDNQSSSSPIIGHYEYMSFGEVIKRFNINKFSKDYEDIKNHFSGISNSKDESGNFKGARGKVYTFQWRIYKSKYFKVPANGIDKIEDITANYSESEEYRKDVNAESGKEDGKYKLNEIIIEGLYQGSCIDGVVYIGIHEVANQAKMRNYQNRFNVMYDYTTTLIKTIGNKRTAYAAVMLELNREFDYTWWLIKKNLKKIKTGLIYVDESILGTKTKNNLLYQMEEDSLISINSSSETLGAEFDDARKVIGSISIDTNVHNVLNTLLSISSSIERTMDTLTGINDARQGIEKATTTATTNQSNLRASRSVTYDMFYFAQKHEEIAMTKILQKEKLAIALNPDSYQYLDEDNASFIRATVDIALDDYMAKVTDGKREHDIKNDIDMYLPADVNAGKINTSDVIDFKIAESFGEAVAVLREAVKRNNEIAQQSATEKNETQKQVTQANIDAAREDREDRQSHEFNLATTIQKMKNDIESVKIRNSRIENSEKNMVDVYNASKKQSELKNKKK